MLPLGPENVGRGKGSKKTGSAPEKQRGNRTSWNEACIGSFTMEDVVTTGLLAG